MFLNLHQIEPNRFMKNSHCSHALCTVTGHIFFLLFCSVLCNTSICNTLQFLQRRDGGVLWPCAGSDGGHINTLMVLWHSKLAWKNFAHIQLQCKLCARCFFQYFSSAASDVLKAENWLMQSFPLKDYCELKHRGPDMYVIFQANNS